MIFNYSLNVTKYGGEHTIGTITKAQADYWLSYEEDVLEDHIQNWSGDAEKIPKQFHLGIWNEDICDILQAYGSEYSNNNTLCITDENTQSDLGIQLGNMDLVSVKTNVLERDDQGKYVDKTLNDANKVLCYGENLERGGWDFEPLELDHPVDISKFRFHITQWDTLWLLDKIEYEGNSYGYDDGDTIGKGFKFWIDS